MITSVVIKNFKRFENVVVPLGDTIVFAGPNNAGKTTAIQALTAWRLALTKWLEKRGDDQKSRAKQRTGVAITRPDMTAVRLRDVKLLWHRCSVLSEGNRPRLIEILVEGLTGGNQWQFGMELQYQGPEMFYCRPMRIAEDNEERMKVPPEARNITIAHLPPLAGLQTSEERVDDRVLQSRISEGRAGDILRNLLLNVSESQENDWEQLKNHMSSLFQVELRRPEYVSTGEIIAEYYNGLPNQSGRNPHPKLDIANAGSGFHQVLLLLAFLYAKPGSVLLFDEPDAHLEIIRQRDVYALLRKVAQDRDAQLIVASHSEVILDETPHENIIAFLGDQPKPLALSQQKSQLKKSLSQISSSDYLLAAQRGGILYVEDYTDVEILSEWADRLDHPAHEFLKSPFVVHIGNVASRARDHFYGLRSAYPELRGVMLIDNTETNLQEGFLKELMWRRREIENYLMVPDVILRFCRNELMRFHGLGEHENAPHLFVESGLEAAKAILKKKLPPEVFDNPLEDTPFLLTMKMSEAILDPFFKEFHEHINEYNVMPKNKLYRLAAIMNKEEIHPEVIEKLNAIATLTSK
jgi:hypothetical protein